MSVPVTPDAPRKPYKAIVSFVVAFLGALIATLQGRTDLDTMTLTDWLIVAGAAAVTAGAVYQTPNPIKSRNDPGGI